MATLTPLRGRCIVKRDPLPTHSEGGIFLMERNPQDVDEVRLLTGVVSTVAQDVTGVKPGERVTFTNWEDMHTNLGDMLVVQEADILGVLEDGSN